MSSLRCFLPSTCRPQHPPARTPSPQNSSPCHRRKDSQNEPIHLPIGANKLETLTPTSVMCKKEQWRQSKWARKGWQWSRIREKRCFKLLVPLLWICHYKCYIPKSPKQIIKTVSSVGISASSTSRNSTCKMSQNVFFFFGLNLKVQEVHWHELQMIF